MHMPVIEMIGAGTHLSYGDDAQAAAQKIAAIVGVGA